MIIQTVKVRVSANLKDEFKLKNAIIQSGLMMLSKQETNIENLEDQMLIKLDKQIRILNNYQKRQFFSYYEIKQKDFNEIENQASKISKSIEELITKSEKYQSEIISLREKHDLLTPFSELSVTTKSLNNLTKTKALIGKYPSYNDYKIEKLVLRESLVEEKQQLIDDWQYSIIVTLNKNLDKTTRELSEYNFDLIELPIESSLVKTELKNIDERIKSLNEKINKINDQLKDISFNVNLLKAYYDFLYNQKLVNQTHFNKVEELVYVDGYIAIDDLKTLEKEMTNIVDVNIKEIDIKDTDIVPTITKNNWFVRQFETITNMYSIPNKNEIDPNPIMSIWYWLIFGMIMGDIGYGLIMLIFIALFVKLKNPKGELRKLSLVFTYSGVSSIIFGILFGSFFGSSFDLLGTIGNWFNIPNLTSVVLKPMDDPLPMLIVSLVLGVFHIITALSIKMLLEIRRKNVFSALADGLSFILILIGALLLVAIKNRYIGLTLIIIGVAFILLLKGYKEKSMIKKALSGLGGLYSITNYVSDVLSYSRILALSLSTAVIAYTMNMLAQMVNTSIIGFFFAVIIYLIGHIFNFVMGLLSAYVHDGRLQYLEYFGKFYEGGGVLFTPFTYKLKYIDKIVKETN